MKVCLGTILWWLAMVLGGCGGRVTLEQSHPDDQPIETFYEYCLKMERQRCERLVECCARDNLPFAQATCEHEGAWRCSSPAVQIQEYDGESAAQCVFYDSIAYSECALKPAYEAVVESHTRACAGVFPRQRAGLGEFCSSDDTCAENPASIIRCDSRTDGVGSYRCYSAGQRHDLGATCFQDQDCMPELICAVTDEAGTTSICSNPRDEGELCDSDNTCLSGLCDCPDRSTDNRACLANTTGTCSSHGPPVVEKGQCELLSALDRHLFVTRDMRGTQPYAVGIDEHHVYWTEEFTIYRADKSTGADVELVYRLEEEDDRFPLMPQGLAVDQEHVYFYNVNGWSKVPKDAKGNRDQLEGHEMNALYAMLLLEDELIVAGLGCELARYPKNTSTEAALSDTLEPDGTFVMLTADASHLYCASDSSIWAWPLAGGEPVLLVKTDARVGPLVAVGARLVWGDASQHSGGQPGELRAMDLPNGQVRSLAPASRPMSDLVYDEKRGRFFWISSGQGLEMYEEKSQQSHLYVEGLPAQRSLVQDEDFLYFTNQYGLNRVPKGL